MYTITVEKLKKYGEYQGWSEVHSAYLYTINDKNYKWNGKGVVEL
jgi:hypothetical protein